MKKNIALLSVILGCSVVMAAEPSKPVSERVIRLGTDPSRTEIILPTADCPKDMIPVLKAEIFFQAPSASGSTPSVQLLCNGQLLDEQTADGAARLLRRDGFKFREEMRKWFNDKFKTWTVFYSSGDGQIDPRVQEGREYGCEYCFDVSDILADRGAKTNKLTVLCRLTLGHTKNRQMPLVIRNARIEPMAAAEVAKLRGE